MKVKLNVESYYWNKESNNLFDYDSQDNHKNQFSFEGNGQIMRQEKNLLFTKTKHQKNYSSKLFTFLYNFSFHKDAVVMNPIENSDKSYITLRHTFGPDTDAIESIGLKLKLGDTIKLGKLSLICRELKHYNKQVSEFINLTKLREKTFYEEMDKKESINLILSQNKIKISKNIICRFCLCEDNDLQNPLIAPCKCSGTMKYIHIDCLRNWLKSKVNMKILTYMTAYSFKRLECELCLTPVPMKFKLKSGVYDLINLDKPEGSYVIFEQVVKEDQDRIFYLITFKNKKSLKIGRSNDSDIRLSDISISRHHANLVEDDKGLFLSDNKSKFGSLLLLESHLKPMLFKPIGIQIGKHFIIIKMVQTFCSYIWCNKYVIIRIY